MRRGSLHSLCGRVLVCGRSLFKTWLVRLTILGGVWRHCNDYRRWSALGISLNIQKVPITSKININFRQKLKQETAQNLYLHDHNGFTITSPHLLTSSTRQDDLTDHSFSKLHPQGQEPSPDALQRPLLGLHRRLLMVTKAKTLNLFKGWAWDVR